MPLLPQADPNQPELRGVPGGSAPLPAPLPRGDGLWNTFPAYPSGDDARIVGPNQALQQLQAFRQDEAARNEAAVAQASLPPGNPPLRPPDAPLPESIARPEEPAAAALAPAGGGIQYGTETTTDTSVVKGRDAKKVLADLEAFRASTAAQKQANTELGERAAGRVEKTADLHLQAAQAERDDALAEQTRLADARKAEVARLEKLRNEVDPTVDQDRYVDQFSTGQKIGATILAALAGGFRSMRTQGRQGGDVINEMLEKRIDEDIKTQRDQIQAGRIRRGNLMASLESNVKDIDQQTLLAKIRMRDAVKARVAAEAERIGGDEARDRAALINAGLDAQSVKDERALYQTLESRIQVNTRSVRKPLAGGGDLKSLVEQMTAARDIEQLKKSGLTQVEYDKQAEKVAERGEKARDFKNAVQDLAAEMNLRIVQKDGKVTVEPAKEGGSADTGFGYLGADSGFWASDKRNAVTRAFSRVQRADVMSMIREPSAQLQNSFASATQRPFLDSDAAQQVKDLAEIAFRAEQDSIAGFNPVVQQDYRKAVGMAGAPSTLKPR